MEKWIHKRYLSLCSFFAQSLLVVKYTSLIAESLVTFCCSSSTQYQLPRTESNSRVVLTFTVASSACFVAKCNIVFSCRRRKATIGCALSPASFFLSGHHFWSIRKEIFDACSHSRWDRRRRHRCHRHRYLKHRRSLSARRACPGRRTGPGRPTSISRFRPFRRPCIPRAGSSNDRRPVSAPSSA